ncbi:hypothetical protein H6P81_009518 [Aristolochia fimbriata]|uniref:WAT1-related protein n=1 Tax=Aristolochia fimbriata TaxID=158543 RepID=A0AAV7EQK8_ARIFI|nr:hypothetical protein H6P81_009518 [Aristolochia fimbriata]
MNQMKSNKGGFCLETAKPALLLVSAALFLATLLTTFQLFVARGISALVLIFYMEVVATVTVSILAFFLEKGKRPSSLFSFKISSYAFLLGLLQIPLGQQMTALSLKYLGATYSSIAINMQMVVVFLFALASRQEKFTMGSIYSQAKLLGLVVSVSGVMVIVLWQGPSLPRSPPSPSRAQPADGDGRTGGVLLFTCVMAGATWNILVERVTEMYPAELSLTALMNFWGTIQSAFVSAIFVSRADWAFKWDGALIVFVFLAGTILGLFFYVQMWCIHKKGPVFVTSFSPLLVVFTHLLEALITRSAHLGSSIGALLVIAGIYLIMWGKAKDRIHEDTMEIVSTKSPLLTDHPQEAC